MNENGSGVVLVRAWMQGGRLVARVRWSTSPDEDQHEAVVVGADGVLDLVRACLGLISGPDQL